MNFSLRIPTGLAVLLLLTRLPLTAADTVELKQQWLAGKKYYETMKMEQETKMEIGGQKMDQAMEMTMEFTVAVSPQVSGQPKHMTIRYERTAMQMTMNGQKMGFDSANPSEGSDPLGIGKSLGATVGKELKCTLNDQDRVESIENYDEFVQGLGGAAVPGFDPSKMFNRDALTQMLQQGGLHSTPGKPVAPGDSWKFNTQTNMAQLGKVTVDGTYTLKGVAEHNGTKCAEIATDGKLAMEMAQSGADAASPLAALGVELKDATLKGTVWFDPKLGAARDTQFVEEMTMSMKNPVDPSVRVNMPMTQHISVTLTKIEDLK